MARLFPFPDDLPLSMQIRSLDDEELLDFWEETQFVSRFLEEDQMHEVTLTPDYERLILQELQLRSCKRCAERRP